MNNYDAIIVGAGLGGLGAALQLQLSGKKTLIIEQHNLPGGCATSFVRGRFEIEPSLHELCDVGSEEDPGHVRKLLNEYGVKIDWCSVPDCFRCVSKYSDGSYMDVTMPFGEEEFITKLDEYVPGYHDRYVDLFDLMKETIDGVDYISASKGHPDSKVLQTKYANMLRTGAYSALKVLKALKLPKKAIDILSVYWSYLGVDMDNLAFIHYVTMVYKYISKGAYIPKHTSHELSSALISRFYELGGEIFYNTRANSFIFDGDRVVGVKTTQGDFYSKVVIANINPDFIYGKMMDKDKVPEREKRLSNARKNRYGARMFTCYMCLDKPYEYFNIKDYSIFMPSTANSKIEYKKVLKGLDSNEYVIFLCYNVVNKEFSPNGTCVVSFTTFGSPNDYENLDEEGYFKFKDKFAKKCLDILKSKTGIDLSGHIEELVIASPSTFARYLGTPEGSVYGHETRGWDAMMARMSSNDTNFPIKGLRNVGAGAAKGDGYSATFTYGQTVAKMAIKDIEELEVK